MNYDLIALDVDGTLINDEYQLTDPTKETIRRVAQNGSRIVLCTGRGAVSTLPLLEELGLAGAAIVHNGAATIDSASRSVLHQFDFTMTDVEMLLAYCRTNRIHFDVNTAFELYVDELTDHMKGLYAKYLAEPIGIGDVMKLEEPILKFCMVAGEPALEQLVEDWPGLVGDRLRYIRSGQYFIDVMRQEATKGNALRALTDQLGIRRERVLAIGNYYNDVEMLEFAGLGVAMDNAPEEVKQRADAVTASNNEDGVSEALLKYCL